MIHEFEDPDPDSAKAPCAPILPGKPARKGHCRHPCRAMATLKGLSLRANQSSRCRNGNKRKCHGQVFWFCSEGDRACEWLPGGNYRKTIRYPLAVALRFAGSQFQNRKRQSWPLAGSVEPGSYIPPQKRTQLQDMGNGNPLNGIPLWESRVPKERATGSIPDVRRLHGKLRTRSFQRTQCQGTGNK